MLFSVYEEPIDARVVAIGYSRSRLITQYFWLGGLDSRPAVRQIIFIVCVCLVLRKSEHTTHSTIKADFLIFTDKKSLKIYKILMCVPP